MFDDPRDAAIVLLCGAILVTRLRAAPEAYLGEGASLFVVGAHGDLRVLPLAALSRTILDVVEARTADRANTSRADALVLAQAAGDVHKGQAIAPRARLAALQADDAAVALDDRVGRVVQVKEVVDIEGFFRQHKHGKRYLADDNCSSDKGEGDPNGRWCRDNSVGLVFEKDGASGLDPLLKNVNYTVNLSTGFADWKMDRATAPKTAPHNAWYKPTEGSWLGNSSVWPAGDTTFTLTFDVNAPDVARFTLAYAVDNRLTSATLNGTPLVGVPGSGHDTFKFAHGYARQILAPAGEGLFVQGENKLSVTVHNSTMGPMGIYMWGSLIDEGRINMSTACASNYLGANQPCPAHLPYCLNHRPNVGLGYCVPWSVTTV